MLDAPSDTSDFQFFVGTHRPSHAARLGPVFISVNVLARRRAPFEVGAWMLDSGAFSILMQHGRWPEHPSVYAGQIRRWARNGRLIAAVTQDYMCEPTMLARTGLDVGEHQRLTVARYDALTGCDLGGVPLMPVLQGWQPGDYVAHLEAYGPRLRHGALVGVGTLCKRNGTPAVVGDILLAIKQRRPDLRLHGFGLKSTALADGVVRALLASADSMAWSYAARREGRDPNALSEAKAFADRIRALPVQSSLLPQLLGADGTMAPSRPSRFPAPLPAHEDRTP